MVTVPVRPPLSSVITCARGPFFNAFWAGVPYTLQSTSSKLQPTGSCSQAWAFGFNQEIGSVFSVIKSSVFKNLKLK
jgi:hypothetical protein